MKTSELIGPALDYSVAKCEAVTLAEHIEVGLSMRSLEIGLLIPLQPTGPKVARSFAEKLRKFFVMLAAHGAR